MTDPNDVTIIEVEFSRGSFQEWSEASGDIYPQAFLGEWQTTYHQVLKAKIERHYPQAEVLVSEGHDQTGTTVIYTNTGDDEEIEADIGLLLEIDNAEMDQLWADPSHEAVVAAIAEVLKNRGAAVISWGNANFCFAVHPDAGWVWRFDMDCGDPLDSLDQEWWQAESLEAAATTFLTYV